MKTTETLLRNTFKFTSTKHRLYLGRPRYIDDNFETTEMAFFCGIFNIYVGFGFTSNCCESFSMEMAYFCGIFTLRFTSEDRRGTVALFVVVGVV